MRLVFWLEDQWFRLRYLHARVFRDPGHAGEMRVARDDPRAEASRAVLREHEERKHQRCPTSWDRLRKL